MIGEWWIVLRSYVDDARLYCDITKLAVGARTLYGVPVAVQGGGPDRGLFIPPVAAQANATTLASAVDVAINNGAQVLVIYAQTDPDTSPRPVIIATSGYVQTNGGQATTTTGQPIPAPSATSVTLMNAGGSVEIDVGGVLRLTPATDQPARVLLGSDGSLQVQRSGASDDHAVLNTPFVSLTNAERTSINALGQAVALQSAWIAAAATAVGVPAPPIYVHSPLPAVDESSAGAAALEVSADRVLP